MAAERAAFEREAGRFLEPGERLSELEPDYEEGEVPTLDWADEPDPQDEDYDEDYDPDYDEDEEDPLTSEAALRLTSWEYDQRIRTAQGHVRYDDPRYWEDKQPDPWKGRAGLQTEAQSIDYTYQDPALHQGNLEGREHLHAQAWPYAQAHTYRDLWRIRRASAPPDDPAAPIHSSAQDFRPLFPARRLGELVEKMSPGSSREGSPLSKKQELRMRNAERAKRATDAATSSLLGDVVLGPFEAKDEMYEDPEFKRWGDPSRDAPAHLVRYDYAEELWHRNRMGWFPWLRRKLHLDDPRWQTPGPTRAAVHMFSRLVRAWGNIDHHASVLDPPGVSPGSMYPWMRSPNDFDPSYNKRLGYRRKADPSDSLKGASSSQPSNGKPKTPSERLRQRIHFSINERGVDSFFNYARLWHYSGHPWDSEGLAFLDRGRPELHHPYDFQPGQFDFDREDYLDYDEDEGRCRKLCKAVFQENRFAVRGLLEQYGQAIANCKYDETFAPPHPPEDPSVSFQARTAWARHYSKDVFIDHSQKRSLFRKKKTGPDPVGDPHAGVTPLRMIIAAPSRDENKHMARMLFRAGADPFATDRWGWTYVHYLASKPETSGASQNSRHDSQLAKMFLRRGVSANSTDLDGHTPLHVAARAGAYEVGQALLEAGADPNIQSKHKATPLHYTSLGLFGAPVTKMLLEAGANPNLVDHIQQTPLHSAAAFCKAGVAQVLLEHGKVDMSKRDFRSRTALQIAEAENCFSVAELIRQSIVNLQSHSNKA